MKKKIHFGAAAALSLAVIAACFGWVRLAQTPLPGLNLTPALHTDQWRFSLGDGTPLAPAPDGSLDIAAGETVYCTTALPELYAVAPLEVAAGNAEIALLLDGALVSDPSGRFAAGEGFSQPPPAQSASSGRFDLNAASGRELTLAVQFLGESANLSAISSLVLYCDSLYYDSQLYTAAAAAALPAGVFLAVGLLLIALFLVQLWRGRRDLDAVVLSVALLAFALGETFKYSHYVLAVLQLARLLSFVNSLPVLALLWLLWQHTSGVRRRWGLLLPALVTGAFLLALAGAIPPTWWTVLRGKLLPLALACVLALGLWEAVHFRGWYRRFFLLAGGLLAVGALWCGGYFLAAGKLWQPLDTALGGLAWGSFFLLTDLLCWPVLLDCLLLAVCAAAQEFVRRDAERQALAIQNRSAQEQAAVLQRSLEQTRQIRHEMRHHFEALKTLCQEGGMERVQSYVDRLSEVEDIPSGLYTSHVLVNAILVPRLQRAKDAGVKVTTDIRLPPKLAIEDADLVVFLSNLLDNAVEAASAAAKPSMLELNMGIYNQWLFVSCENSFDGPLPRQEDGTLLSTKPGPGHSFGMRLMRRVAEKYGSELLVQYGNGIFSVKTSLALPQACAFAAAE